MSSRQRKMRPNFFMAFKIDDNDLVLRLQGLQESIIQESIKSISTQPINLEQNELNPFPVVLPIRQMQVPINRKAHVTTLLFTIESNYQLQGVIRIMKEATRFIKTEAFRNLSLEVKGIGSFDSGRVVYVSITESPMLVILRLFIEIIHFKIKEEFPFCVDSIYAFDPHLTIFKAKRYVTGRVSRDYLTPFNNEIFGNQIVSSLDLLGMEGSKDGYYVKYATLHFDGNFQVYKDTNRKLVDKSQCDIECLTKPILLIQSRIRQALAAVEESKLRKLWEESLNKEEGIPFVDKILISEVKKVEEELREKENIKSIGIDPELDVS